MSISVSDSPKLVASPGAVKILLGNLIKNAFTYTEEGAVVINVDTQRITVSDTGVGFDDSTQASKGYGLGLLIANDICRKYGWTLTLDSNGHGGCDAVLTGF